MRIWFLVPLVGGVAFLGTDGAIIWLIYSLTLGVRALLIVPGIQFELLEADRRLHVRPRYILYTGLMDLFGELVVGGWIYLAGCYGYGVSYYGSLDSFDPRLKI